MAAPKRIPLGRRKQLAVVAAVLMLLDNITTILAIRAGAVETNPVVGVFLGSMALYILFTLLKAAIAYILTIEYVTDLPGLWIWIIVMAFFARAIIVNTLNVLTIEALYSTP